MNALQGNLFVQNLNNNIRRYFQNHYTKTASRHKRSMTHDPRNRLSSRIAETITFEESRINKRSVRDALSLRSHEMLYPLNNCAGDTNSTDNNQQTLITVAHSLRLRAPIEEDDFFRQWNDFILPFNKDTLTREEFAQIFSKLPEKEAVSAISTSHAFQRLFWPFVYDITFMNQKLALFGLTGEIVPSQIQKSAFYAALEKHQGLKIPVVEGKVAFSFDNIDLVDSLIHYDATAEQISVNNSAKHLFDSKERKEIVKKTEAALDLIKETMPELHKALTQTVGCFGFYKAEDRAHISGSMNSAIGVIWFDPSSTENWTVPFYAEQIVHEYIHTSLYMAELVHGVFTDHKKFPVAKVMSSIRLEDRDYDKSFHACYVSTGLVAFHAKAGFWTRAQLLAETIGPTLDQLIQKNIENNILTPAGEAMLFAMRDFLLVIRLID